MSSQPPSAGHVPDAGAAARSRPRQVLQRDERRAQILRAAAAAFSGGGFAATSVDDVAKQAGITKLIVYRHFESKGDLYRQVLNEVAVRLAEEWTTLPVGGTRPGDGARVLLTVAREMPDGFRLFFVHASREVEFAGFVGEFRELLLAVVATVVGDQVEAGPHHDWVVALTVDVVVAAVLQWIEFGDPSDDERWLASASAGVRAAVAAWATPFV